MGKEVVHIFTQYRDDPGGVKKKKAERREKRKAQQAIAGKMNFLEDIVAFIYSRLDEAAIPPERLVHPRVFELRNHVERGRCSPRAFRKRRAACDHRKCWITSPLAQEPFDDDDDLEFGCHSSMEVEEPVQEFQSVPEKEEGVRK